MLSEKAQRNAAECRKQYDAEHMDMLTTKLPAELAEAFRAYAAENHTNVSRLLADYVRSVLRGGDSVDDDKKKVKVTYNLWASTRDGIRQIAEQTGVSVDDLINGVLCEFIAKWTSK